MRAVSIILIAVALLGCKAKRDLVSHTVSDNVKVTEQYIEKTVTVPGDSVKAVLPIVIENNQVQPAKIEVTGHRAKLKVEVTGEGIIEASANCDEYEAKVEVLQRTVERFEREVSVYTEKETGFQKTIRSLKFMLKLAVLVIAGLGIWKFSRPVLMLIVTLFKNLKNK